MLLMNNASLEFSTILPRSSFPLAFTSPIVHWRFGDRHSIMDGLDCSGQNTVESVSFCLL
jgi:hypothetical protein